MAAESDDDPYGEPGQGGGGTAGTGGGGVTGSAAAKKYYASFPPDMQEKIRTSTGGNLDEWFNNAVAAGAVQQSGERNPGEQTSDTGGKGGGWTPERIRQHFQGMGYDTFDQIDDNTLWTWINKGLWDPSKKVFKSEQGDEIDYTRQPDFKPQDCPEGMTPLGSGGKCVPNDQFDPNTGAFVGAGGGGAKAATTPAAGTGAQNLQSYLTALMQNRANIFQNDGGGGFAGTPLAGGGVMWSPFNQGNSRSNPGGNLGATIAGPETGGAEPKPTSGASTSAIASPYGGYNPAANSGSAALTSATLNAFNPAAAPSATSASPTAQALTPPSTPVTPPPTPPAQPFSSPGGAQPGAGWASSSATSNPLVAQVNRRYNPVQGQWWNQAR